MKIILSKKGYDDKYGGKPSIILPDRTMISFPIPVENEIGVLTENTRINGQNLRDYFIDLELDLSNVHHLDPVIQDYGQKYNYGVLGQADIAASHLSNQGVTRGDIFLFYGTFCFTYFNNGILTYEPMHPFHCIWGYLVIDKILKIEDIASNNYSELMDHPHYQNKGHKSYNNNLLYIGTRFGAFKYSNELRLTKNGYKKTYWSLPGCFINKGISWNGDKCFSAVDGKAEMLVAKQGQEFVIDSNSEISDWVDKIISS